MKKKLLTIDEKIFNDVKKRYARGVYAYAPDSVFIRNVLENLNRKLNRE